MLKELDFNSSIRFLLMIMFRESAKTSWAKIKMIKNAVYNTRKFQQYVCFDKKKAEGHLFDIALELQTNESLINDYGQLFFEESIKKQSKKKTIGEFITANGIKFKANSTGVSTRGELFGQYRPDFYIVDDFETDKTKYSKAMTMQVKNFIDELMSGISGDAQVVFLGNRISHSGSIAKLEKIAEGSKYFKVLEVPIEKDGEITWKSKFVKTNAEADKINNKLKDKKKRVVSLEERRATLGTNRYMQEYFNVPIAEDIARYRMNWIEDNYYEEKSLNLSNLDIVMAVDPNAGLSEMADFMGICVMGMDRGTNIRYVLESMGVKLTISEQVGKIKDVYSKWSPRLLGIEVVMNQRALYQLAKETRQFRLIQLSPDSKDKVERSSYIEPLVENGIIKFNPSHSELHQEMVQFPFGEHDDRLDSFIYANQMLTDTSQFNHKPQSQETQFGNLLSKTF